MSAGWRGETGRRDVTLSFCYQTLQTKDPQSLILCPGPTVDKLQSRSSYIRSGNLVRIYDQVPNNNMALRLPSENVCIIVQHAQHSVCLKLQVCNPVSLCVGNGKIILGLVLASDRDKGHLRPIYELFQDPARYTLQYVTHTHREDRRVT